MKRAFAPDALQPAHFSFDDETLAEARRIVARYPQGRQRSAVLPVLDLAQRAHGGWLPRAAVVAVAELLEMPEIQVFEVATFYTMFNLAPVGRHYVQLCRTTPCWLRGADEVRDACRRHLGIGLDETTPDGMFTLVEVECLGACVNAPVVQIGDDYYEDLDAESVVAVLGALKRGGTPAPGPQTAGRRASAPKGGPTTLLEAVGAAES